MSRKNESSRAMAERLRQALASESELTCEQAEELLPLLVQAEGEGADVLADPQFSALFRHFETCERCAEEYAALTASLNAFLAAPAAPLPALDRPPFFAPSPPKVVEGERWVLQLWQGLSRKLRIEFAPLTLATKGPVLSADQTLFADQVRDLPGAPLFTVVLNRQDDRATLRVALREVGVARVWRVQLSAGGQRYEQLTNERGIAEFSGLAVEAVSAELTISCVEVAQ